VSDWPIAAASHCHPQRSNRGFKGGSRVRTSPNQCEISHILRSRPKRQQQHPNEGFRDQTLAHRQGTGILGNQASPLGNGGDDSAQNSKALSRLIVAVIKGLAS
jgi:hypothetical protein